MSGGGAHGLIKTDQTTFQASAQSNVQGIPRPQGGRISKTEPSRNVNIRRRQFLHLQAPLP